MRVAPHLKENTMITTNHRVTRVLSSLGAVVPAALFAAVVAFAHPGVATAADNEWDIGSYDDCIRTAKEMWLADEISLKEYEELQDGCCITSGGIVDYSTGGWCRAPGRDGQKVINPGATQPLTPDQTGPPPRRVVPPTGTITQDLEPAAP
jgi:hypothetical protein